MPPKKKEAAGKKTQEKAKAKVVEVSFLFFNIFFNIFDCCSGNLDQ